MAATTVPGLARYPSGGQVAGVCAGVAAHLRVDVRLVRAAFAVLAVAGGVGLVAYAVAWLALPVDDRPVPPPARPLEVIDALAVGAVVCGLLLGLRRVGVWLPDHLLVPAALAAAGAPLLWARGRPGVDGAGPPTPRRVVRLAGGSLLVVSGMAVFLAGSTPISQLGRTLGGALVALVGLGLILLPQLLGLRRELGAERRERIRSQERAELAAHLHDSVLQTLALIQRRADDPRQVVGLARRQERELRGWLYGSAGTAAATTMAGRLGDALAEVEQDHGVPIEAVVVGDAPLDARTEALVLAVREAATNAARHSGAPAVDVYLEVEPGRLSAFVRDRGRGFDPAAVPADRHGLAESVHGRMGRAGGRAEVRSAPGEGTEVELELPR